MKAPLLYLSLFSLVWAQSELQPHYKKSKQKCMGEHQIMVKNRNAKHGYYIFHYVYSSLTPGNHTWIKKEEDDNENISSGQHGHDKEKGARKPIDNHTAEEKEDGHKSLIEIGNDSESKDRGTSESTRNLNEGNENSRNRDFHRHQHRGNSSNTDILQNNLAFIADKGRNDTATDNTAEDIDGSGDLGFVGQTERHHSIISGNEDHNLGKNHQDARGTEADSLWERNEVGLSGTLNDTKVSKDAYIKTGVKEKNASVVQEINPYIFILSQSKDSNSKDYLDVFKKIQNATKEDPDKEGGGYVDSLDKGKEENASARLQNHFNVQGKISGDLLRKTERITNRGDRTNFSGIDEVETVTENVINYSRVHKKGDDEYSMINRKLDGQNNIYGETKPPQKNEVRDNIINSKHTEVVDVLKTHKKVWVKEDIITGRSNSHMEVAGISETHKEGKGTNITGKSISQVENPIFTQRGKTNQTRIVLSGRINGSGLTKSYTKGEGEDTLLGGMSISQRLSSGATNQGQSKKDISEVGIIHRKSNNEVEGFHSATVNRKAESHEKINRNDHRDKQDDPVTQEKSNRRLELTLQEGNKDVIKGNISYRKVPGTADLSIDSSSRKAENRGQKSVGIKSALTLAHGSHNYKHTAKNQEHPPYVSKDDRKITKPSKKRSGVHNGRHGSSTAKRYHGHLGVLQRKSSRHNRKGKSVKNIHANDSSQSSESEESRNDSRQSYEDYQNDNPDSYQSTESMEENLFAGSNQSNDQNQTGEVCSQEDSQEHKSN